MTRLPKPMFSIVSVTRNNLDGLCATFDSIRRQTVRDLHEWIVVDGASTDETVRFLRKVSPMPNWTSTPDGGIYDAMNRAIERASGDYLLFLNAGDRLAHPEVLCRLHHELDEHPNRSVRLGRYELQTSKGGRHLLRYSRSAGYMWHGLPTSHQAILYPVEVFEDVRYDPSYAICGDYALTASIWRRGYPFTNVPVTIASFTRDGVSSKSSRKLSAEARMVQRDILRLPIWERVLSSGLRMTNTLGLRALAWWDEARNG
jgi:putative colanic acid biosynthesis glycosyltransferase